MRIAPLLVRLVTVAPLIVAAGCASPEPEVHSVLIIDALAVDATAAPMDVEEVAGSHGCATSSPDIGDLITLIVDDFVSPDELVITGRYGTERIRPRLDFDTTLGLESLRTCEDEIVEVLRQELGDRRLLEPVEALVMPPVTSEGLRIVGLVTPDHESFDSILSSILDRWSDAERSAPSSLMDVDLAVVPHDSQSLEASVRVAAAKAERWTAFRAPPGLVVEWGDLSDIREALSSALDHPDWSCWNRESRERARESLELLTGAWAVSLPGARILVQEDREWCALELHFVLLHELMHQHQYALCGTGLDLAGLPALLLEAHATALALQIMEQAGLGEVALAMARQSDPASAATRAFDRLRAERGVDADGLLRLLASEPDRAQRLVVELQGPLLRANLTSPNPTLATPIEGLTFQCTRAGGEVVVTIVNETDAPFSGFSDGYWYSKTLGPDVRYRQLTAAPFALRLPPHGRVALKTRGIPANADPESCFTVFRRTPTPEFGR